MTTVIAAPTTGVTAQDTVALNVSRMVALRHVQKQELAKAMGTSPASMARKLRGEITWSINETSAAADFLGTDVATLLKPDLSLDELLGNGGYNVAVSGDGRRRWGMAGLLDVLGWSHNDLYLVSRLLGHDSVETTQRYVAMPESRLHAAVSAVTLQA